MELHKKLPQCVVAVPDYNWSIMPLGGFPGLGIAPFSPQYAQPNFRIKLSIPGTPTLISRAKDTFFPFNRAIEHFGVVFATGPEGWPLPDDLVFELQAKTNHEHTPMPYKNFYKGGRLLFYPVQIDSKENVIRRLEEFFRNPRNYNAINYNCESFAREIMTGVAECKQVDRILDGTKMFLEIVGKTMIEAAEQERKRQADLDEAKRRQTATLQVQPPSATPPPDDAAPVVQKPLTVPEAMAVLTTMMTPAKTPVAKARMPAKRPRKKAR